MLNFKKTPLRQAVDPSAVGTYPAATLSGGGWVYDDVLEYRVWQRKGFAFQSFKNIDEAIKYHSSNNRTTQYPIVLVRQCSYYDEHSTHLSLVNQERITEWQIDWLHEADNDDRFVGRPNIVKL